MTKVDAGGPDGRENNDDGLISRILRTELDPGISDPGYWDRFRSRILSRAAADLARRRAAGVTVGDVLEKWSRTLVPLAAAAAAVALILTWMGPSNPAPPTMGIEEALTWDLEDEVLPTLLGSETPGEVSAFILASEAF
ncbi:MAG: hypothetical protein BMS9Abin29_1684 [Gemmatimonadota bacterium]|nr:MAG: hypothetical protein BMS9Abin29_1684 [Gemmatimonadota bacterium]